MKRSVSLFLSVVLLLSVFFGSVVVNAAATPQIVCEDAYATPGEQVTVDIMIENNPGFAYLEMTPVFSSELTNMKVTNAELISDLTQGIQLVWVADEDTAANGLLASLTFDVAENVPYGEYSVSFILRNCFNYAEQSVPFTVVGATVTVGAAQPTALSEFEYEINGNELTITAFVGTDPTVILADTYEIGGVAYTVTAIGVEAFMDNEVITSFVANPSLKLIDEAAFYGCTSLMSATIPGAQTEIAEVGLGYVKSGRKDVVLEGFQMFGLAGSGAETYAAENEIPFTVIEEEEEVEFGFAGASITLQHNLAVNFKADKVLFTEMGYANPSVVFEMNGKQTTVSDYAVQDDRYVFTFSDIAPNQMNDEITATLSAEFEGQTVTATKKYSVAEYCYSMLAETTDAELRTLLVDLLHYGAASQTYTGYNTANLVDANLTAAQLAWGTATAPALESVMDTDYKTVSAPAATWTAATLVLKDSVSLRMKLAAENIEGLSVKVATATNTWTIPASDFVAAGNGQYYVYFTGLNAAQMRETLELTVYNGDTAVSNTALYSIESYAAEQHDSTVAGLADLLDAMMKYGDAANAYAN